MPSCVRLQVPLTPPLPARLQVIDVDAGTLQNVIEFPPGGVVTGRRENQLAVAAD